MLINSHLLLLGSLQTYRRELKQITQYIKKHKGPVLWAGDFNTWYTSRQNLLDDTTQNLGLQKASWRNDTRSQRLDHAYIREFEVVSATVLAHIRSSDHSPLHLEVRIKSD